MAIVHEKVGGAHPLSIMMLSVSVCPLQAAQCTAVQPSSPRLFRSFLEAFLRPAAFPSFAACRTASDMSRNSCQTEYQKRSWPVCSTVEQRS